MGLRSYNESVYVTANQTTTFLPPTDSVAPDSVADSGRSSTDSQAMLRASPVGMSLQVQEPAAGPSLSASHGSAETLCDDDVPQIPLDTALHREGELASL